MSNFIGGFMQSCVQFKVVTISMEVIFGNFPII